MWETKDVKKSFFLFAKNGQFKGNKKDEEFLIFQDLRAEKGSPLGVGIKNFLGGFEEIFFCRISHLIKQKNNWNAKTNLKSF